MSTFGAPDPRAKIVTDVDFVLATGVALPLTVDWENGDTIVEQPDRYIVENKTHRSMLDPEKIIPAKTFTIFKAKLGYIHQTERTVSELTPEQQVLWKEAIETNFKVQN